MLRPALLPLACLIAGCHSLVAQEFVVRPGFQVEELYQVPIESEGSWVSICTDSRGNFYTSDQHGRIYHVTPPPLGQSEGIQVRPQPVRIGRAHGLCWAYDSLYFVGAVSGVEGRPPPDDRRSVWRARDTNGDGELDEVTEILRIQGSGEHGPHTIVAAPGGRLYLVCGNHTPALSFPKSAVPRVWSEDHLLPRMWDARGHARGIMAPGGWIARMNPDGGDLELVSIGYRNEYDVAFDANGEMFTFDSDMEWDMGTPWYRPTRISHVTSGSEFGWRSGSGKWPDYYPDSLPPSVNIGPGSPTGVAFGTGTRFPVKYQRALYAMDWSFGTLYAVHLESDGASYKGTSEVFLSRNSLPLTDLAVRPQDGALYFVTGGRRTRGGLYRVTYTGGESTAPAAAAPLTPAQLLRRQLEGHHREGDPGAVAAAWPHLESEDRFIRFAARTAIELQAPGEWRDRALAEERPRALRQAVIALARCSNDPALQPVLIERLLAQSWERLDDDARIEWLRACSLVLIRLGNADSTALRRLGERLDPLFPTAHDMVNRELGNLLIYLQSPTIVARAIEQMYSAADPEQARIEESHLRRGGRYAGAIAAMQGEPTHKQKIHFAFNLRHAREGWTSELREKYFAWFSMARQWKGGNSFQGFLANARDEALEKVGDEAERARLLALASAQPGAARELPRAQGPGKAWTLDDFQGVTLENLRNRDLESGRRMYGAALCAACHRFGSEGAGGGPDLTGSAGRYTVSDLLAAIVDPNRDVSDQYAFTEFTLRDGRKVTGRIVGEDAAQLSLMTTFIMPDAVMPLRKDQIVSRQLSPLSPMMPGLINSLNREEVLDLLGFLMSAAQ